METDLVSCVDQLVKKKADIKDRLFTWQLLEEERLEAKLQSIIKKAKEKTLRNFDKYFVPKYSISKEYQKATAFLLSIKFDPRIIYTQVGEFRFKRFTFPIQIKDWLVEKDAKDVPSSVINIVSDINSDPFNKALNESVFRGYGAGGQSVFHIFDIDIDFALRDENVESWLKNYELHLSQSVTQEISSKIKFEIIEGMRNAESIPEIKDRILFVWDKPIDVIVPAKVSEDGVVIRQGYQYSLKPEYWASTVARTEISRAFAAGKLEGYQQTKVVEKVEWLITPDERLCPNCSTMDGEQFTLEQAQGLIPLHGGCRCTWIPILLPDKSYDDIMAEAKANVEILYGISNS
jgi:SPP1 gp7 family putative phage head morphogenesis protein